MATLKNTTITSTDALTLPSGTTAERPVVPLAGMIRYNSTLSQIEIYNGSDWQELEAHIRGSIFAFEAVTLTPGGSTGNSGPSLAQGLAGLSVTGSNTWTNNRGYYSVSGGIQRFTVPVTGTYRLECIGASGGEGTDTTRVAGGRRGYGTRMRGDFDLIAGTVLSCLVGQRGLGVGGGGGGGGSFIWMGADTLLLAAGGGGGGGDGQSGVDASTSTSGTQTSNNRSTAGTNGQGGGGENSDGNPGAGAGWYSNGGGGFPGIRPLEGGTGGNNGDVDGGFGGGGAEIGTGTDSEGGGGGGGYSGGAASGNGDPGGGGGGSFNIGANQSNTAGIGTNQGSITITLL